MLNSTIPSTPTIRSITQKSIKGSGSITTGYSTTASNSYYPQNYLSIKDNNLSLVLERKHDNQQLTSKIEAFSASPSFIRTTEIEIPSLLNTNKNIASLAPSRTSYSQLEVNINRPQFYQEKNKNNIVEKFNLNENSDFSISIPLEIASKALPTTSSFDIITTSHSHINEDLLRSASVKAESNCGGVSSSCYESLSEDSDGYEDTNQNKFDNIQSSSSNNMGLTKSNLYSCIDSFKIDKSDNELPEGKKIFLFNNFLLNIIF